MTSQQSTVEVFAPMCSCGREIGLLQYSLQAKEAFRAFNGVNGAIQDILFSATIPTLLCCRRCVMYPKMFIVGVPGITEPVQRLLPTALPGPLKTANTLEWYGSV